MGNFVHVPLEKEVITCKFTAINLEINFAKFSGYFFLLVATYVVVLRITEVC